MKSKAFITIAVIILMAGSAVLFNAKANDKKINDFDIQKAAMEFQKDADIARLQHLVYWTGIVEDYYKKANQYPFQDQVEKAKNGYVLVKIATKSQREFLSKGGKNYNSKLDNNGSNWFEEVSMKDFVVEIEDKLGPINEYYDVQKVPTTRPIGYYYFATKDGYLIWTTCVTCGVTPISTLLMDASVATVNITSPDMKENVTKALTREEMLTHPTFKKWILSPYQKEGFIRMREKENINDSKN